MPSLVGQSGKANELDHRLYEQRANCLREVIDAATKLRENATDIEDAIEEIDGYLTMLKELAVEVRMNEWCTGLKQQQGLQSCLIYLQNLSKHL